MADHPLRPATRLCLGEPLPPQLADGPQTPPLAIGPCGSLPLSISGKPEIALCGISAPFGTLSPSKGQVIYVLRTRAPLYSGCPFRVRLACVRRAANVRSEPGSNSPVIKTVSGVRPVGLNSRSCVAVYSSQSAVFTAHPLFSTVISRAAHSCACVSLRFSFQRSKPFASDRSG